MRPSLAAAAGVLALAWASPVCPEPLSLDIILGLERFGRVAIDPSGAVGVFEERRARSDLPRHDLPAESAIRQARLYRIDLDAPGLPRPLLPMAKDAGYTLGAFSPTGRSWQNCLQSWRRATSFSGVGRGVHSAIPGHFLPMTTSITSVWMRRKIGPSMVRKRAGLSSRRLA